MFPDGSHLAFAGDGPVLHVWPVAGDRRDELVPIRRVGAEHERDNQVHAVAVALDGSIACADNQGHVHVFGADGDLRRTLDCSPGHPVFCLDIAPDGAWLASGGSDSPLRIWGGDDEAPLRELAPHEQWVSGVAMTRDGRWLASCYTGGTVRVWDTATWDCVTTMRTHGHLHRCCWSQDGQMLAVTSGHGVYLFSFRYS